MKTSMTILLCEILICAMVIAGCSNLVKQTIDNNQQTQFALSEGEALTASFTDSRLPGMKGIAENKRLQLYINDQTAEIAVLDKTSGEIWRSNPSDRDSDPLATGVNKDMLSSQVTINFYNSYGQISSVNSCTDSTAYKQMAFEMIPGGVRVSYRFGTDEKSIEDMPQMISKERFEERLLSKLDKEEKRALIIAYKEDKEKGVYVRNDSLKGLQLQRALEAFETAGYTEEDLAQDIAENNLNQTKPIPRIFHLSIEYMLDGDSLVVKVPVSSIQYPEDYPVNQISVLNFFGAGGAEERGSLFVPDGSGSLIHFNNGKSKYSPFQLDVYGRDLTIDNTDFLDRNQKVRMPIFGLIKKDSAFLAIIEQGASVATINADISGRLNSYNYVYSSFYVINKDDVTLQAEDQKRSLPKFQEELMKSDFVLRYVFLDGEDASYQGMARYYQQYLVNNNMLAHNEKDQNEDTPFYLQLIGSISKQKHFLGVPYQSLEPLTTVDEAKSIISQLKQRNISNIKLRYAGWFNEGFDHKVPKSISVDRTIGGIKGLVDFLEYARDEGISFYPDIAVLSVNNTSGFSESRDASRRLTEAPAVVYPIDQALNRRDRERSPSYILSPRLVRKYIETMLEDLEVLHIGSISLRDLADQLNSDYRKNSQIDRTESEAISVQALKSIQQKGLKMMADGGNAYAWPYLMDITNAPLSNSNFKLEDEAIPFYQMVVRGFIEYAGAPYNLSTYTNYRQYVLKCLEYGSYVYFTWIYEANYKVKDTEYDYLYSVHYKQWIDLAEQMYQEVNKVLQHVRNQRMIDHEKLEDGVFKTVYENGIYVIVNYNRSPVLVNGMSIEAESFAIGGERS